LHLYFHAEQFTLFRFNVCQHTAIWLPTSIHLVDERSCSLGQPSSSRTPWLRGYVPHFPLGKHTIARSILDVVPRALRPMCADRRQIDSSA
jgi:hypothetical protein